MLQKFNERVAVAICFFSSVAVAAGTMPARETVRELYQPELAATAIGRELVNYLVGCALPPNVSVTVPRSEGEPEILHGLAALAPDWEKRQLNDFEQRTVSACILARTNLFGRRVTIFMDGIPVDAALAEKEQRPPGYRFEGGFFGNLFESPARAYVCTGNESGQHRAWLERSSRVCTLAAQTRGVDALSRCGFRMVGACNTHPFVQDGVDYHGAVVDVYLPEEPLDP